jgi:fumarylacetoacetase
MRVPSVDLLELNATHDPARLSWLAAANAPGCDFPIQNLPFGVFQPRGAPARGGVAIGDQIVDLRALAETGLVTGEALKAAHAASGEDLTPLLELGRESASALRAVLSDLLWADGTWSPSLRDQAARLLVPMDGVEMRMPLRVRQFSDMCVSTFHIGRRRGVDARGEPICPPVFRSLPVGYDGRASSVVVSGTPVRRPNGVWQRVPGEGEPQFGPEPRQDYELELALWFGGAGNALGDPIPIHKAGAAVFGYGLLNDWSARGIQMWETMLGPFLGKSLATTVSPWIVTAEALAPFRARAFERPAGAPPAPRHLVDPFDQAAGNLDLVLEAWLISKTTARAEGAPFNLCRTNFRHMYWTPAQMIAHHASNGCAFAAGDLLGSGTCSGPALEEAACLLERTLEAPLDLAGGERRQWLEDGDTVILRGRAERDGFVSIGFGEARGTLLPAVTYPI